MNSLSVNQSLVRMVLLLVCLGQCDLAQANPDLKGRISAVYGSVKVIRASNQIKAKLGQEIGEADKIQTEAGGMVQVRFNDGSSFTVYEKSSILVESYRRTLTSQSMIDSAIEIAYGKLRFFVNPNGKEKKNTKFKTKTSVMGIRGTSGIIDATDSTQTKLLVLTGTVQVSNPNYPNMPVMVGANSMTRVTASAAPLPPTPASESMVKSLIPASPQAAGFTDDSAAASSSAAGLTPENSSPRSTPKESEENSNDASEEKPVNPEGKTLEEKPSSDEKEKTTGNSNDKSTDGPSVEKSPESSSNSDVKGSSNEEKTQGPTRKPESFEAQKDTPSENKPGPSSVSTSPARSEKSESQQNQTRSGKILFAPGGEVVKQEPSNAANVREVKIGGGSSTENKSSRNDRPTESNSSPQNAVKVESTPQPNVMRQVERTTSQVKSTVESVDKKVQTTIQANSVNTPTSSKIKLKINLPKD